jgi:hypothetical protein
MRTCPNCGLGRLEPIATIFDPNAIAHILAAMGRGTRAPQMPNEVRAKEG